MNQTWGAWGATKSRPAGLPATSAPVTLTRPAGLPAATPSVGLNLSPSASSLTTSVAPTATLTTQPMAVTSSEATAGGGGGRRRHGPGTGAGGGSVGTAGGINLNAMTCYELDVLARAIPRAQERNQCREPRGGFAGWLAGLGAPSVYMHHAKGSKLYSALATWGCPQPEVDGQYLGPCRDTPVHGTSYGGVQYANLGLNQGTWASNDTWAGWGAPGRRRRRRRGQGGDGDEQRQPMSCDTIGRRIARLQRMLATRCGDNVDDTDEALAGLIASTMPTMHYGAASAAGLLLAAKATPGALVAAAGPAAPFVAAGAGLVAGGAALAKALAPIKTCAAKRKKAQAFAQAARKATGKTKESLQRKAAKYAKQAARVCPRADAKQARRDAKRGTPDMEALDAALGIDSGAGMDVGMDVGMDAGALDTYDDTATSSGPSTGLLLAGGAVVAVIAALALSSRKGK